MIELTKEIEQAIAQIGEELGAEMIVHNGISVGAKKEIGGETFGNVVFLHDDQIKDGSWRITLDRFKKQTKINFGIERDKEQNREGG
jgi:hypothetical protein